MIEILKVIVMLCQTNTDTRYVKDAELKQLQCQQYYVKCLNPNGMAVTPTAHELSFCITRRKM